jgi:hypothetical protein
MQQHRKKKKEFIFEVAGFECKSKLMIVLAYKKRKNCPFVYLIKHHAMKAYGEVDV